MEKAKIITLKVICISKIVYHRHLWSNIIPAPCAERIISLVSPFFVDKTEEIWAHLWYKPMKQTRWLKNQNLTCMNCNFWGILSHLSALLFQSGANREPQQHTGNDYSDTLCERCSGVHLCTFARTVSWPIFVPYVVSISCQILPAQTLELFGLFHPNLQKMKLGKWQGACESKYTIEIRVDTA